MPVPMLVIRCGGAEPVGLCAVPGRLPEVTREPGESWEACIERARQLLRGSLPVLLRARYEPGNPPADAARRR